MNKRIEKKLNKRSALILIRYFNFSINDFSNDFQDLYFVSNTESGFECQNYVPYKYLVECAYIFNTDFETDICQLKSIKNPAQLFAINIKNTIRSSIE